MFCSVRIAVSRNIFVARNYFLGNLKDHLNLGTSFFWVGGGVRKSLLKRKSHHPISFFHLLTFPKCMVLVKVNFIFVSTHPTVAKTL